MAQTSRNPIGSSILSTDRPLFGAVLNGSEFLFIKLVPGDAPKYGLSDVFSLLNRGNDLYQVLKILKRFSTLMVV
jgi:hypothetical protein